MREIAAKKSTKFMTNCEPVAVELGARCDKKHQHRGLTGGKVKEAAIYPEGLCRAICLGLAQAIAEKEAHVTCLLSVGHMDQIQREDAEEIRQHDEDEEQMATAWDDVSGAELDVVKVKQARCQELVYIKEKEVWRKISRKEAIRKGITIVGTQWIDINKGDRNNPWYRSRLVAQEFNTMKELGIFAATPPLEALSCPLGRDGLLTGCKADVAAVADLPGDITGLTM